MKTKVTHQASNVKGFRISFLIPLCNRGLRNMNCILKREGFNCTSLSIDSEPQRVSGNYKINYSDFVTIGHCSTTSNVSFPHIEQFYYTRIVSF